VSEVNIAVDVDVFDLSVMRHAKVKATSVPNVWRISLPVFPWKLSLAEQERQFMVKKLSAVLPYRALWFSDWASDERPGWHFLACNESMKAWDNVFNNGAWVLFFFEHAPGKILDTLIPTEPTNLTAAAHQIHDLGVSAAIWSWYDDIEWLVVFPSKTTQELNQRSAREKDQQRKEKGDERRPY
jgi:hypothetical protein